MKLKFKLIALVLVVVVALALVLSACNNDTGLFRKNQERVGKQITSDATFADRVGIVTLNDLYGSYYNYYQYLYTYYQYGYINASTFQSYFNNLDETFANYNENLAREALFDLKCIDYLYQYFKSNATDQTKVANMDAKSTKGKTYNFKDVDELAKFYKERYEEIKAIFECDADYYYANKSIKYANDQMQKLFDDYLTEVKAEYAATEAITSDDETPKGYVGIDLVSLPNRLVYEKDDASLNTTGMVVKALYEDADAVVIPNEFLTISGFDASSVKNDIEISVQYGKYTQTFTIDVVEALPSKGETAEEEEDEDAELAELTENNTKLLDYFTFKVEESEYVKEGMTASERKAALKEYKIANTAMNRVTNYLKENYRNFDYYLYSGFMSQLENAVEHLVNAETVITKAELEAKYDEQVAKELEGYYSTPYGSDSITKETIVHKSYDATVGNNKGYYYVTQILIRFDEATLAKAVDFDKEKVANEEAFNAYLNSLLPEVTAYTFNPDYDKDATCENEKCDCPRCVNYSGKEHYVFDSLEKWYGLYEGDDFDDPCVDENGETTCTCVACPTQKYADKVNAMDYIAKISQDLDSAATIQEKLAKFNEYVNLINTDSGIFSNIKDGKIGYLMTPEGIDSGMIKAFEEKCDELALNGVGSYGYTIGEYSTDKYGIHFIMVTEFVTDESNGTITDIDGEYCKLGLDYVTDIYAEKEEDETPVILDGSVLKELVPGSIGYYLWQDMYEQARSTKIGDFRKAFLNEYAEKSINYYPKAYKSLIKDIQDGLNQ